jgi:DNA-binding phage protein
MTVRFTPWDVADGLLTDDGRLAYLHAAYEEDPGDGSLMRAALRDVARARKVASAVGPERAESLGAQIRDR